MRLILPLITLIILISCSTSTKIEQWKNDIVATEKAFNDMAKEKGLKAAFLYFAADDAVLSRGGKILQRSEFEAYFDESQFVQTQLQWKPDFVDVSASGDLGYTYGSFTFQGIRETGDTLKTDGIFHTVWRRQYDGSWRYVWD